MIINEPGLSFVGRKSKPLLNNQVDSQPAHFLFITGKVMGFHHHNFVTDISWCSGCSPLFSSGFIRIHPDMFQRGSSGIRLFLPPIPEGDS